MQTKHLPRTPGIYQIRNKVNGKVYIGRATDPMRRCLHHRQHLRDGTHPNRKLLRAWQKYGYAAFEASVIEHVADSSQLVEREQFWFDTVQPCVNGYNVAFNAESNLGLKFDSEAIRIAHRNKIKPMPGYINPRGEVVTIENTPEFCKEHGFNQGPFNGLAHGRVVSYKGWTHVNAKKPARKWINTYEGFIDPDGMPVEPITNLEQFCREHGLIASNMNKVYRGLKKTHRGWTHSRERVVKPRRAYPGKSAEGYIDPNGNAVVIQNMAKFCRENKLDESGMGKVRRGVLRHYKGWTYQASAT